MYGLLAGAAVTFAGTTGQLWVVFRSATVLDLGGVEDEFWLPAATAIAGLLLVWYSWKSTIATLEVGSTEPPPSSSAEVAAAIRQAAEDSGGDVSGISFEATSEKLVDAYPGLLTSPGDIPRRSAVL